ALSFLVLHLPPSSVIYTLSLHDALPILAPLVSLNSKVKSKAEKTSLLIISPPLVVCPSGALAIFNAPCSTIHPDFGKESLVTPRSEEHTSELQSRFDLVCRLLLEKKKQK